MSAPVEQPDPWQQNAIFTNLLQTPSAKQALTSLEQHLKPIFNSHAFYSLDTGMLTVKLNTLTSLLTNANLLPHLTPHDFKLGLHLAITPTLSQSASPSKHQPLHFDTFINALAFCAFYYPPQTDPVQIPISRQSHASVRLEVSLDTLRHRLVASTVSPRTIIHAFASPATTTAFATPLTSLPDSSPTQTTPPEEHWFTPARSAIRTNLFSVEQTPEQHAHHQPEHPPFAPVSGDRVSETDSKSDACDDIRVQNTAHSHVTFERSEEITSETVQISSPPTPQSHVSEQHIPQQEIDVASQVEESVDRHNISDHTTAPTVPPISSPQVQLVPVATQGEETNEPSVSTPNSTPEASEGELSGSAPTNLSLAPSSAFSQLPSPDGNFVSPELTTGLSITYNASSIEPRSSRKLSFSDSEDPSDTSSCYENGSDIEDTMTRIENAFEHSHAVIDCDEDDVSSDPLSPHSELPSSNAQECTVMAQSVMEDDTSSEINLINTGLQSSTEGETDSEQETASQTGTHDFLDSHSISNESDSLGSDEEDEELAPDALNAINENEQASAFEATRDIALSEPRITLGLPAGAFSEPGGAVLRTPAAPKTATMFPDSDMEDMGEEDHTLLFENGNESDGSELSMHTRETMSKMVEDYLSLHGSASPPHSFGKNFYAEEQVLGTPDRKSQTSFGDEIALDGCLQTPDCKSQEAFVDGITSDGIVIAEDGPCVSEKTETKQSGIAQLVEKSICDLEEGSDGDKLGFKVEMDRAEQDEVEEALSPMLYSEKDSFSSEITPDGFNLIKKQLVLPSPFAFSDSTVGSSMSSGPNTEKKDDVKRAEVLEQSEQALVAVSVKKEVGAMGEGREVCCSHEHEASTGTREVEMMQVMRETLETCRVLREEVSRRQRTAQKRPQQQYRGVVGRWIEFGVFGLIIVLVTLVLVERRIQRGLFVDVLV